MLTDNARRASSRIFFVIAGLAVAYLAYVLYRYMVLGTYLDHAEPDGAILSWRLASGAPLYDTAATAEQILTAYGPILYIVNALPLILFGGGIGASKLGAFASLAVALVLFGVYAWRRFGPGYTGIGVLAFVCYPLIASPVSFWLRPEAVSVLLVTVALFSTLYSEKMGGWLTPVVVAACAGLAMNLKVHSFIYFVPIVIAYCSHRWVVAWPVMAVVSIGFFFLPFALPNVSLTNYVQGILEVVSAREIEFGALKTAAKFSQFFLAPGAILILAALTTRSGIKKIDLVYFIGLVVSIVISLYPSSVPGSTWYHMLPFFPISADLFLRFLRALEGRSWVWVTGHVIVALAVTIATVTPQKRLMRAFASNAWGVEVEAEIAAFITDNPDKSIQMGYGSDDQVEYRWTFARPLLAFAGNPVTISPAASMERQFAGKPPAPVKIRWIEQCKTELWLIPKVRNRESYDHTAFSMNGYFGGSSFHDDIRKAFLNAYEMKRVMKYFEVWACRR